MCISAAMERPAVVIVGAGISGLAAASVLHRHRIPFLIVEARNRIGGRLHTDYESIPGVPLDLGASWIHGTNDNPIAELARGLKKAPTERFLVWDAAFQSMGKEVSTKLGDQVWQTMERAHIYANKTHQHLSWHAWLRQDKADWSKDLPVNLLPLQEEMFQFKDSFEASEGSVWSLKQMDIEKEKSGDHVLLVEGYKQILNKIGGEWLSKEFEKHVRLGCVVERIDYSSPDQVKIHTSLGLLYSKSVLCTMPFSLLRANHGTLFHPSLPMSKINSLNSIGWGTLNKIVLHFDSKFWPDDCDWLWSFIALDRSKIEASTKRKLKKPHDSWLIGFLSLWEQWKTPVLVTYIHADSANYFETLSETEAANILVEQLQKMFPEQKVGQGKFALKKCIVTRWGKDPWAQGSYTNVTLPSATGGQPVEGSFFDELARPLPYNSSTHSCNLFFAGEHTHRNCFATVHGAYESGIREGERIAGELKSQGSKL